MVEAAKAKSPVKVAKKQVAKATKAVKKAAPKAKAVAKKVRRDSGYSVDDWCTCFVPIYL